VDFFGLQSVVGIGLGLFFPLEVGRLFVDRVHLIHLVGFPLDGYPNIICRLPHTAQSLVMVAGVDRLGVGDGPEQAGNVGHLLLLGPPGKQQVAHVGLALSGEGIVHKLPGHFSLNGHVMS